MLIFFIGAVFLSTAVPSWCIELESQNVVIKGHLHLFKCHVSSDKPADGELIEGLATARCHGDDHCKQCFDIPISTANAFHNPANFKKEIGKFIVVAADYRQPFALLQSQNKSGRLFRYGFQTYLPNQLLQALRTVVLLN